MFHQQLKICHWWFYVDCEASEQFYNLNPDILGERQNQNSRPEEDDSLKEFGPRMIKARALDSGHGGRYHRRVSPRPRRFRQNNHRRRIGARPTNIRRTRPGRFPKRRSLTAVPTSSFRKEQSSKRRARQVESEGKTSEKNIIGNFEEEIQILKEEILKALSYFWVDSPFCRHTFNIFNIYSHKSILKWWCDNFSYQKLILVTAV